MVARIIIWDSIGGFCLALRFLHSHAQVTTDHAVNLLQPLGSRSSALTGAVEAQGRFLSEGNMALGASLNRDHGTPADVRSRRPLLDSMIPRA
jgi:hypothetical protein